MAQLYDLMLLVDPTVPEDRQSAVVSEVEQMISSGGELVGTHDWGTRRLAYEIDHRPEAAYRLYQFNAEPGLLERLQQRLRIMDGVLRFRIIRLKPGSPPPPPPRDHAPPRPREEREREPGGRVAARAAADAPPAGGPEPDASQADAAPADAPPAESTAP
jgi:small subunit ribosomal protein S6